MPDELFNVASDRSIVKDDYLVGYVGNLSPIHSVDVAVKAMNLVQKKIPCAQLLIVGTGDPKDVCFLNNLMTQLHVEGYYSAKCSRSWNAQCI